MRFRRLPRRTDSRQGARTRAGPREPPRTPSVHRRGDLRRRERHSRALSRGGGHLKVKYVKHSMRARCGKLGRVVEREARGWPRADLVTTVPGNGDGSAAAFLVARTRLPSGSSLAHTRSRTARRCPVRAGGVRLSRLVALDLLQRDAARSQKGLPGFARELSTEASVEGFVHAVPPL